VPILRNESFLPISAIFDCKGDTMRFLSAAGFGLLLAVLSSGCRCGWLDNASGDLIDTLTERRLTWDCLYKPELDLSRIGKPDWCRSPLNRLLCRDKCCGTCGNSYQSGCCHSAVAGCQSTTGCCNAAYNQDVPTESVTEASVPVLQSTWENETVPTSEASFEELPPPEKRETEQATR
jgi:hypothetical protein